MGLSCANETREVTNMSTRTKRRIRDNSCEVIWSDLRCGSGEDGTRFLTRLLYARYGPFIHWKYLEGEKWGAGCSSILSACNSLAAKACWHSQLSISCLRERS